MEIITLNLFETLPALYTYIIREVMQQEGELTGCRALLKMEYGK